MGEKTIVFLREKFYVPSSYYRFFQYFENFDSNNLKVYNYTPNRLLKVYSKIPNKYKLLRKFFQLILYIIGIFIRFFQIVNDMFFLQSENVIVIREMFPRRLPFGGEFLLKRYLKNRNVYWDFDDNIIPDKEITGKESRLLERYAKSISITSDFLKDTLMEYAQQKAILLPTTDITFANFDTLKLSDERKKQFKHTVNLCWIGTKSNIAFLEEIIKYLDIAAQKCNTEYKKDLALFVVSNEEIRYSVKYLKLNNITWTREKAIQVLEQSHIGLMPLKETQYTKGKGGFKAVQYIGAGIPSIVSDVGFNSSVIKDGFNGFLVNKEEDWINSVLALSKDEELWTEYSLNARQKWKNDFHSDKVLKYWKQIIE